MSSRLRNNVLPIRALSWSARISGDSIATS